MSAEPLDIAYATLTLSQCDHLGTYMSQYKSTLSTRIRFSIPLVGCRGNKFSSTQMDREEIKDEKARRVEKTEHIMHEMKAICREFTVVERENGLHCEEREDNGEGEKQCFHTHETQGGIRGGTLEDEADVNTTG